MSVFYCNTCLTTFSDDDGRCTNLSCGTFRPASGWGILLGHGDLLDRHYRIERPLAVGGAGLTYLAQEVDHNGVAHPPDLAIKVLYSTRATGSFLRRLSTEAQILQELDHDNIVQLRGFVHRAGAEPYLVTLFEHGGNLAQLLDETGPLPVKTACSVLMQILWALDVAHQRGIVHRDLKPDNVLLREKPTSGGVPQVRVADFGIAKVARSVSLTQTGSFVGTPEYAAPEQFDGMPPTPATDVFAAGALFVHLLTGDVPIHFSSRTDVESTHRELLEALPMGVRAEQLRDATAVEVAVLNRILQEMMHIRPERRATLQTVLRELERIIDGEAELQRRDTVDFTTEPAPTRLEEPEHETLEPHPTDVDAPEPEPEPEDKGPSPDEPLPPTPPPVTRHAHPPVPTESPPRDEPEWPDLEGSDEGSGGFGGCLAAFAGLGIFGAAIAIGVVAVIGLLIVILTVGPGSVPDEIPVPTGPEQPEPPPKPDPAPEPGPAPEPSPQPEPMGEPLPMPEPAPGSATRPDTPLDEAARRAVLAKLDTARSDVESCGASGGVVGTVWVREGRVVDVQVDDGYLEQPVCVAAALLEFELPPATGWMRFAI